MMRLLQKQFAQINIFNDTVLNEQLKPNAIYDIKRTFLVNVLGRKKKKKNRTCVIWKGGLIWISLLFENKISKQKDCRNYSEDSCNREIG